MGGAAQAGAFTLNVVGADGGPVGGYRWLVEEDNTHDSSFGVPTTQGLGVSVHKSHAPVLASGDAANTNINLPASGRYFISVLPDGGYAMGGAQVKPGQGSVTVTVQPLPMPTAQISIQVFEDNGPINNALDVGENGLGGFKVIIDDTFGQVLQDAFGNPLGTRYQQNPGGGFVLDTNGDPVVEQPGSSVITTGPCPGPDCGKVLVKNLAPGKYGIRVVPPAGQGWQQTSTIEGTKTIDAWVRAGEPAFFIENGPPGHHAFFGFVRPFVDAALTGGSTLSGRIVNMHNARPPVFTFNPGHPIPSCWVGLNELAGAGGRGLFAAPCSADSSFTIPNVPPGDYQLAIWDANLDLIFAQQNITVNPDGSCKQGPGGACALGDVPVFNWFGRLENTVFLDNDQDGFPDAGEPGMPEQAVNLRFRDGTIYQSFPTDLEGFVPFDEVFPFFKFLVAEVDFTRFKATGLTVVVDNGGAIPPDNGWAMPSRDMLTPQAQIDVDPLSPRYRQPILNPNTGNNLSRTETGPVLTQAFQSFLGSTSLLYWGKAPYGPGENGGISGIVYYATTRAEDDPRYAAADPWEPGIPRVQVALYQDSNVDGVIDDLNGDGAATLADVDNHPLGNFPAAEDQDHNGNGLFDAGDAVQIAYSDSFDDAPPTGCPGEAGSQNPFPVHGNPATPAQDCFEGLRTYNQVRDGVFDGGYAFGSWHPGGIASGSAEVQGLPPGMYIVQAAVPPGYLLVKEEDRNVDGGASFTPALLPPVCVGDVRPVPASLVMDPSIPAPYAGQSRPLCDRKQVPLTEGRNAAADFHLYTIVPKAARAVGFVLNDLGNEFNPNAPAFGEKYGPPWLPIAIRDFAGHEISRVYSDEWGNYNALIPSTQTVNLPTASGISPNMARICLNDPGPIPDPAHPGQMILDPAYQPQFTRFCYTFQFHPGRVSYLDTPILPNAAFSNATTRPVDCELENNTPAIATVSGPQGGPWVAGPGATVQIRAQGTTTVPNPAFDPALGTAPTISRDYGFGTTPGTVQLGNLTIPAADVSWGPDLISFTLPAGATTGQLNVTRGDSGRSTAVGVTLTVGGPAPVHVAPGGSIQAAIDGASPGDLILVPPGAYDERVILWKNVRLQGWGAGSTVIQNAVDPAAALANWRAKKDAILASGAVDLVPNQNPAMTAEEAAAITVLAPAPGKAGQFSSARIDGFTLSSSGSDTGGGIFVNGYAHGLTISNNRILSNRGTYGGGIRIGHPRAAAAPGVPAVETSYNEGVVLHHNQVIKNAALFAGGGGIALFAGSDNYRVQQNLVCGNFSAAHGGGIAHMGLSDGGRIENNRVLFNQSFNQMNPATGGGLYVGGETAMDTGAGNVQVVGNLIQGNQAGAGDGGGIAAQFVNGQEVAASPANSLGWYRLDLLNNIIVNNMSGMAGAGIALQDTVKAQIIGNTVAHNDSTATAGAAFGGNPNLSTPQPAGIVARAHSTALADLLAGMGDPGFSDPVLANNIVWHNRSFHFDSGVGATGALVPDVTTGQAPVYTDLAVLGAAGSLTPQNCLLSDAAGYDPSNLAADPLFVQPYLNSGRGSDVTAGEFTTGLSVAVAFDEGGNYIDVGFSPLMPWGDYHLSASSPAVDAGDLLAGAATATDFDGQARPMAAAVDIGADEFGGTGGATPTVSPVVALGLGSTNQSWTAQPLSLPADLTAPVVIAGPPSFNGPHPGVLRLRNVGPAGFEVRFQEWMYLDGWHGNEQFSWMVLRPGRYTLDDGSIWEVGRISLDGTGLWQAQGFGQPFAGKPALFLTAQSANGNQPVTVRARNLSANGFEAALFEEEALMDGHFAESVGYLAVWSPTGAGSFDVGGTARGYSVGTAQVGQAWADVLGQTASLKVEEEQSKDAEVWHLLEEIAVLGLDGQVFAQDVSTRGNDPAALRRR